MTILSLAIALSSAYVAAVYLIAGLVVFPNLHFPWLSALFATLSSVGFALKEVLICVAVFQGQFPGISESALMLAFYAVQAIGLTGFVITVARKRLIVTLEGDDG